MKFAHDPLTDWCTCERGGTAVCSYRLLADAVIGHLNPPDSDDAEESICVSAVERITEHVRSLPCTCPPGSESDEEACGRCAVLGQYRGEAVQR